MRRTLVLFAGIAPLLGCTLLVDLDAVRRNRDAGHQGATDAGAVDSGTNDAGTSDAGSLDSGTTETGPYDGGTRCATSTRPRLRCAAPLQLGKGGPYSNAVLQAVSSELLAGWNTSSAVHLERVLPDGGEETWLDQPASAVNRVMLSAEGSSWALLYQTAENLPLWCFSSADDGGVSPANASGSIPVSAVAVSAAGGVAVARSDTASSGALSAGFTQRGCPRSLKSYPSGRSFVEGTWVGAAHIPGTNTEGFRFTTSSLLNYNNSAVAIWAPGADGGLDVAFGPADFQGLEDEATAVSASGQNVMIAYSFYDTQDNYHLGIRGVPTNLLSTVVDSSTVLPDPVSFWATASCGPGCTATVWAPYQSPSHVAAVFTSDDPNATPLTQSITGWDVACGTSLQNTSVAAVSHLGRLWVLVAESSQARLFACDVPPL